MSDLHKHKARMAILRDTESRAHVRPVPSSTENNSHLLGEVSIDFITSSNMSENYSKRIHNFDISTSRYEVQELLASLDDGNPIDHILEPIFLSLFDGTMRAFRIGTKQGITATRLYSECKSFNYESYSNNSTLDSYTEYLNESDNIKQFDSTSTYNGGKISRDGTETNMRDQVKMSKAKEAHFDGYATASDGYGGNDPIYENKTHAKSAGEKEQRTEVDHAVPCAEVCNKLKKNKALTDNDIKEIVNIEENLVATSFKNNRGTEIGKFDKSRDELAKEIELGYVIDSKGKKRELTEDELKTRANMVEKMDLAQKEMDSQVNRTVIDNLKSNRDIQKRMSVDAANAATNQSLGDVIIFMIKPLYYELTDCLSKGIEEGVNANSFKSALSFRFNRMKKHILEKAATQLKDSMLSFVKNFLSMLLEGIVNCFVGVFKSIFRMIKEGFKILLQIIPIIKDKKKSMAEKGDAILKLAASSLTIFASIGIESWLNSLGLGEPWSIVISSVLTAVLTALMMYLLDKLDLFGLKEEARLNRIDEILALKVENSKDEIFTMIKAWG